MAIIKEGYFPGAWVAGGVDFPKPKFEGVDPSGKDLKEPGTKGDLGKSPVFRGLLDYFPRAVETVARVSEIGARKYSWKGWESVPDGVNRYTDALARHLTGLSVEGDYDRDTGALHRAQIAWNALAALELYLREQELRKSHKYDGNDVTAGFGFTKPAVSGVCGSGISAQQSEDAARGVVGKPKC